MAPVERRTPGIPVTEASAFPPTITGVETAVPAFIGYTEKASQSGDPVTNTPVVINSLAEFEETFGGAFHCKFTLSGPGLPPAMSSPASFLLYNALRLFYRNGGGRCYIVSVGDYNEKPSEDPIRKGLTVIGDQVGPTMLLAPDALLLDATSYGNVMKEMLAQCGARGDRVAIFDVQGGTSLDKDANQKTPVDRFRDAVGAEHLNDGMAYFPWLCTSIVDPSELGLGNFEIGSIPTLKDILKAAAPDQAASHRVDDLAGDTLGDAALDKDLRAAFPVLSQIYGAMAAQINVLPASAAMAGVYTKNDATMGVWQAPANISLEGVIAPTFHVTSEQQDDLNVPIDGKAINAIREFAGRGTLVWGARTLDGNSNEYRYIQVRRALIYIEQSIKNALNQLVFLPNDASTWTTVVSMVSNFLTGVWTAGGLMGAKPSEAFTVQCGLGSTMTGQDVLNGIMIVQVTVQMIRPAEFIELVFSQTQGAG